jgi:hypothetical protein
VGTALVAIAAAILVLLAGRPSPTALAAIWAGLTGACGALLVTICGAYAIDWIHPYYGGDGPIFTGFLLAVILVFAGGFVMVRRRRGELSRGELATYGAAGAGTALIASVPVYQMFYPGYEAAPSDQPYVVIAILVSAALCIAWFMFLWRVRRRGSLPA